MIISKVARCMTFNHLKIETKTLNLTSNVTDRHDEGKKNQFEADTLLL